MNASIPPQSGTRYGCFNRAPITTYGKKSCQYTLSTQGLTKQSKDDPRCAGCIEQKMDETHRKVGVT